MFGLKPSLGRANTKVLTAIARLMTILKTNILGNNLVCHVATGGCEVTPCPQVTTPELLLNMPELHHQLPRCLAFEVLNQLADRQVRRARHEQVHVIRRNMPLENLNLVPPTHLDDQFAKSIPHGAAQDPFAIFRDPDNMVFDVIATMRTRTIVFHDDSLDQSMATLKVSPKGEGFRPIERQ